MFKLFTRTLSALALLATFSAAHAASTPVMPEAEKHCVGKIGEADVTGCHAGLIFLMQGRYWGDAPWDFAKVQKVGTNWLVGVLPDFEPTGKVPQVLGVYSEKAEVGDYVFYTSPDDPKKFKGYLLKTRDNYIITSVEPLLAPRKVAQKNCDALTRAEVVKGISFHALFGAKKDSAFKVNGQNLWPTIDLQKFFEIYPELMLRDFFGNTLTYHYNEVEEAHIFTSLEQACKNSAEEAKQAVFSIPVSTLSHLKAKPLAQE